MKTKKMDRASENRLNYMNFIVIRFARGYKILIPNAFRYLDKFGGLNFLYDNYEFEHTQSEHNTCMTLLKICRNNGGWL
jgi:hypothetical protein